MSFFRTIFLSLSLPLLSVPLAVILSLPAIAAELRGKAKIIDAQSLRLAGENLHLVYIHAPGPGEVCPFKERTLACGRIATTALMDLTAGATVVCRKLGRDRQNRQLARCWADGYDLSEGMVYTGWARAARTAPARYHEVEKQSRARRRGLWRGAFPASVNKALANNSN